MTLLKYLASAVFLLVFGTIMLGVMYLVFVFNIPTLVIEHIGRLDKGSKS